MKGLKKIVVLLLFGGIFTHISAQKISLTDFHNGRLRTKTGPIYPFTPDGKDLLQVGNYVDSAKKYPIHWFVNLIDPHKKFQICDTLFHSAWFKDSLEQGEFTLSENRNFMLVEINAQAIYRHSVSVNAYVVDLKKKITLPIPGRLRYPTLSPDNSKVAYVRENNLFVYDLKSQLETQITTDGAFNALINGAVDWVYEEEFSMSRGFEWSPTGRYIAYYKFDESQVNEFSMDEFHDLYPDQVRWKYPKAGEDNSRVDVYVYDLSSKTNTQLPLESEKDQYIPRIQWLHTDKHLSLQRLNRLQNFWELLVWNTEKSELSKHIQEGRETYLDINESLTLIPNSTSFLYLSDISGYRHIYSCDYVNGRITGITEGKWQVNGINAFHTEENRIYYNSTEASTVEDHVFSVKLNGKDKKSVLGYKPLSGNQSAITSKYGQWMYIINSCMTETPHYQTILIGKNFRQVHDDTSFRRKVQQMDLSAVTFDQIPVKGTELQLNYYMIKPKNFDPAKKYPLLMHCYGGPGNSIARNSLNSYYAWYQFLASKGYIVVCVDNRGTGNQGEAFQKCTYKNLGRLEQEDQRMAAQYFGAMSYIDTARVGIWGWSFGGYLTSLCMVKSPDIFKMGIAVAPVTHWKYYDNIYTERYLQRPIDNPAGYEENSPINFTKNMKGNYLIIHGTGDDNVHFQNSAEMIKSLIQAGSTFDSEIYPNRAHGISDRAARVHLFNKMTRYILENL